ncbi:NUDIX domain-containing protein [Virgibacillus sp. 6R]|uniref:NUDIX domain-containing protein n=1 Tax=Metabacillus sp. 22489 TaxID=3453928 RepID=UPI0011AAA277
MNILSGGSQEPGETLKDADIRECLEEVGVKVKVKELLFVSEYIGKNHEHSQWDSEVHVVTHLFACTPQFNQSTIVKGTAPDPDQIGNE